MIAAANASLSCGGTSSPVTPSSIISGIPPTFDATTGRDRAIASRTDRPCASRYDGRTGTSRAAGAAGTAAGRAHAGAPRARRAVSAPAGEHDPMGDPQLAGLGLERVAPAPLADHEEV